MKRAIQKHVWDFVAIVGLALISLLVAAYVLSHQRFYLPSWVPAIGSDFVDYNAEFSTAQAVVAGQGQTIQVAGVSIGEIGKVTLKDGKAVVQMKIRKKYTPIYRDATALLRPKTGLNDMVVALDPGNASAGSVPEDGTIPVSQTQPAVQLDEFLAGFDADTRDYLQLLVGGAGEGLHGNAEELAATLKRFDPTARYLKRINRQLAKRDKAIARSIHNFKELSEALGDKDAQLARFVDSSNKVFQDFASEQDSLKETIRLLPNALEQTNSALEKSSQLSATVGPTLTELMPTAEGLAPALKGFQSFAKDDDADVQGPAAPVRAGRRAVGQGAEAGRGRPRRVAARPHRLARRPELAVQRDRLQPARQGGGLPLLARLGEPPRRLDLQRRQTRTARSVAASSTAAARRCSSSRSSARPTRSSACCPTC